MHYTITHALISCMAYQSAGTIFDGIIPVSALRLLWTIATNSIARSYFFLEQGRLLYVFQRDFKGPIWYHIRPALVTSCFVSGTLQCSPPSCLRISRVDAWVSKCNPSSSSLDAEEYFSFFGGRSNRATPESFIILCYLLADPERPDFLLVGATVTADALLTVSMVMFVVATLSFTAAPSLLSVGRLLVIFEVIFDDDANLLWRLCWWKIISNLHMAAQKYDVFQSRHCTRRVRLIYHGVQLKLVL